MASANGFKLEGVNRCGGKFEINAAWAAPFFAFIDNTHKAEDVPMLYHAETRADAERFARSASSGKPVIFNHDFEVVTPVTG